MEKLTINQVMARSFINTMQFAMTVDVANAEGNLGDVSKMRFRLLTDAQLSVLYNVAQLVTDRREVFVEYDRMLAVLKNNLTQEEAETSVSLKAMVEGRKALSELLDQSITH